MKSFKTITYFTLALGIALGGTVQAWPSLAALPFTLPFIEANDANGENGGLLNRLSALYEATKSLSTNTKWLSESIKYVGREDVVKSLNNLAKSGNELTTEGIKINPDSIKQIALCSTATIAALSGIAIITHTAFRDDAKHARTKYTVGAGLTALGILSVLSSNWLIKSTK